MDYCSSENPCRAGEGDCDEDRDCSSGLFCAENVGSEYGYGTSVDVCEAREGVGEWKCYNSSRMGFQFYSDGSWEDLIECDKGCDKGYCKSSALFAVDSDDDGYSDDDEELAGSNPYSASSTPFTELKRYSETIKQIPNMGVVELIENILEPYLFGQQSLEECEKHELEVPEGTIYFAEKKECVAEFSQNKPINIYFGFCMGFASGFTGAITDFVGFFIQAFWYLAANITNLQQIGSDLGNFINGLTGLFNAETLKTIWDSYYKEKLQEGANLAANNTWIIDKEDTHAFSHSYVAGHTGMYIATMVVGGKTGADAVKALKTGAAAAWFTTQLKNYPRLAAIMAKGGTAAQGVTRLAKKYPLSWVDDVISKTGGKVK